MFIEIKALGGVYKVTKYEKKRVFVQFEFPRKEKEELKQFVEDKEITMSDFVRESVRFFIDRDITPRDYITRELDRKSTSMEGITDSFLQNLERRDLEIKDSLNNIHKEMRDMKNSVTRDLFEYLSSIVEEIEKVKGSN